MELLLLVPDLLQALKTQLTEVWSKAKSPAAPLGVGAVSCCTQASVTVTLQLLFFLAQLPEHEGRARTVGKGHFPTLCQKNDLVLCAGC